MNPEHISPERTSAGAGFVDPQLKAAALGHPPLSFDQDPNRCSLTLQLVSHIALESQSGVVKTDTMANR